MRALILSADAELTAAIERVCGTRVPSIAVVREMPGMLANDAGIAVIKPDLLLFEADGDEGRAVLELERAAAKYPQASFILLTRAESRELLITAMRLGIREVVTLPLRGDDLNIAINRLTEQLQRSTAPDGKVMSFVSCKGGSGTTFIAANLGHALAGISHKKTLLIDLNLQFGDATLYVSDTRPTTTLSELCRQIGRLDEELLASSLVDVAPNFGILAASLSPDPEDSIRPDHVAAILQEARRSYDYVLLDLGRQINGVSIRALDVSDVICPVLQQSLPFLRNGRRLLDMFTTLGYRKDCIQPVVNRYDNGAPISIADMERGLGHRIAYKLPNNFDVASESINQGMPVLSLARGSNLSKGFVDIVKSLTHVPEPGTPGLIRRLFVRNPALAG